MAVVTLSPFRIGDLGSIAQATEVRLSPDGSLAVVGIRAADPAADQHRHRYDVVAIDGSSDPVIVTLEDGVMLPRWSPDGPSLLTTRHLPDGRTEILARRVGDWVDPTVVVAVDGHVEQLEISPIGREASLEVRVMRPAPRLADLPDPPACHRARIIDQAIFRDDMGAFQPPADFVLFVLDLETGRLRRLDLPNGVFAHPTEDASGYHAAWYPDGDALVVCLSTGWDAQYNLPRRQRDLYRVELGSGRFERLTDDPRIDSRPSVSGDGRMVAFLRQAGDPDGIPFQNEVWVIGPEAGPARPVLADPAVDVTGVTWLDETELTISYHHRARRAVHARLALDGRLTPMVDGLRLPVPALVPGGTGGRYGSIHEAPDVPGDPCIVGADGTIERILRDDPWIARRELARSMEITFRSEHRDQREIHAIVAVPAGAEDLSRRPVVVDLHGGPDSAAWWAFDPEREFWASQGYVVIAPNYRGSRSFGRAFLELSGYRRYPGWFDDPVAPHEMGLDVIGALRAIVDQELGDVDRVFLRGFSAGALLASWVIGRTDRFRAAAAHAWYPGEWSAPSYGWFQPRAYFDGPPWEPEHADEPVRRDPMSLVSRVRTPLLLVHGESDHVTPLTEVEKYYYALRSRGVDVTLALFPDEGHHVGRHPRSLRDRLLIEAGWFARHDRGPSDPGSV